MENNTTYILDDTLLVTGNKRFFNYLLDNIFIILLLFLLGVVLGFVSTLMGSSAVFDWLEGVSDLGSRLIFVVFAFVYYSFTEGLFGRSIAKFITGTTVVDENGAKPSFGIILKRSLCRLIPFDIFSFLGSGSGWHDSISNTYVVVKKELEQDMKTFHELKLIGVEE